MNPGSHIKRHCSSDNLRVGCHLALKAPLGCKSQVGREFRSWQEDKTLFLGDSFWREAWNHSSEKRLALLLDFWRPDLTDAEIRAIAAFYKKTEIRCPLAATINMPASFVESKLRPLFPNGRSPRSVDC